MAKRQAVIRAQKRPNWSPWVALVALIAVVYGFVVYPYVRGEHKVRVEFSDPK